MELTANQLTQYAKKHLENQGFRLNRVNNVPWGRRKGTIEKGWADLQGYSKNGKYVAVEVKKIGDKLSKYQIDRLQDVTNCGGIVYICTEKNRMPTLVPWEEMKY